MGLGFRARGRSETWWRGDSAARKKTAENAGFSEQIGCCSVVVRADPPWRIEERIERKEREICDGVDWRRSRERREERGGAKLLNFPGKSERVK